MTNFNLQDEVELEIASFQVNEKFREKVVDAMNAGGHEDAMARELGLGNYRLSCRSGTLRT